LKEGENVETGVAMAFSTPRNLRPKVCTKIILQNFYEAVYLTDKQRPTLKAIHNRT